MHPESGPLCCVTAMQRGPIVFGGDPSRGYVRGFFALAEGGALVAVLWLMRVQIKQWLVAAAFGVIAATVVMAVMWQQRPRLSRTVCSKVAMDLSALSMELNEYAEDHGGRFPASLDELFRESRLQRPDRNAFPTDSWKRPYLYFFNQTTQSTLVMSLGSDGRFGGTEKARDRFEWWRQGSRERSAWD